MPKKHALDFLQLSKSRKTVYEYSSKQVGAADLEKMLETGKWAPSCGNSQPWLNKVRNNSDMAFVMVAVESDYNALANFVSKFCDLSISPPE